MPASPLASPDAAARRTSDLALIGAVLIWGINFSVLKALLALMPLEVINAFRFSISWLVLGGLYAWRGRRAGESFFQPLRDHTRAIIGLGLLGYVLYQYAFIVGLNGTTAGSAALIMASSPLWTGIVGHVFGIERVRRAAWGGLLLSLLGTTFVVLGGPALVDFSGSTLLGNVFMLTAAACWGVYTALNKPLLRDVSPSGLAFFGLCIGLPFLLTFAVPEFHEVQWEGLDALFWLGIVYSGGLSTGLALVLWNIGVQRVGPSQTAVFNNVVPVVALIVGAVTLGEVITWVQLLGGAGIVGGVLLMRRSR